MFAGARHGRSKPRVVARVNFPAAPARGRRVGGVPHRARRATMATRLDFPPSTGTYRTLVVPVLEPGQAFRDPDLTNLTAALRSGLFNDVTAYFRENSFDALDLQFQVFGQDVAPRAQPLRLPRAIREYWNPGFEAGGFDAVVAGLGAAPTIALDGTEALRLAVGPRLRPATAIDVTFSALSAERSYGAFPVSIPFAASDELRLRVTDRLGTARDLVVGFPATSFSVNASSVDADLAAIASLLEARIQAATAALNLPGTAPALLQPVRLRRV